MRKIDTASYSAKKSGRIKPEKVDLGPLPPLEIPETQQSPKKKRKQPGNRDTMKPSNHDTTVSWYHDTIIERVRKAVKDFGKEAATHRFTVEEKKAIADIIYSYKNRGIRTSENEIARIAVNFIVEDYRENGENSVLDKALKALNE
jgi:hypothetical protein